MYQNILHTSAERLAIGMDRVYRLRKVFKELNCNYALVKGEALSLLCYGRPGMRISSDIDILVDRKNVVHVEHILLQNGFSPIGCINQQVERSKRILCMTSSHQLPPYVGKGMLQNVEVDINFDIFWGEYTGQRIVIDTFLNDVVDVEIYGQTVKVLTPIKAMIHLALHHYKEMNSLYHLMGHKCITRSMFNEVYLLWKNNSNLIPKKELIEECRKMNITAYMFYVLHYSSLLVEDKEFSKLAQEFWSADGEALLNKYGLALHEQKMWRIEFMERLDKDLYDEVRANLTLEDFEKIERMQRVFG